MLNPFRKILAASAMASLCAAAGAQRSDIIDHIVGQDAVEQVRTSLNYTSLIEFPEPVTAAVIGSQDVRMEYRDSAVVLEPQEAGVKTNLFVWTAHHQYSYEVEAANPNVERSFVLREIVPPPPPPPRGPTPKEAEELRDSIHDSFLMTMRDIRAPHFHINKEGHVNFRIEQVGEDHYSYYVRLVAVNRTDKTYRISTPSVNHIIPTFGAKMAVNSLDQQLTERKFHQVLLYDAEPVQTHGSSLLPRDLHPGQRAHWVMAINKPAHAPSMFEFVLPNDQNLPVHAVAVF